jgi:hypothetical protein
VRPCLKKKKQKKILPATDIHTTFKYFFEQSQDGAGLWSLVFDFVSSISHKPIALVERLLSL